MQNTVFDNDKFISIIQNEPALWDNSDADYADKIKKDNGWRAVMSSMYGEEEVQSWDIQKKNEIGKELQKKRKNLRNSFAREMAKRKKNPSGSARTWRTYMYFEQLSFLTPTMRHAEVQSNLDSIEEEAGFESGNEGAFSVPHSGSYERHTRKRRRDQPEAQLAEVLAKSLKWRQEKDESLENDPDRLFLLSLLEDFKKIPPSKKTAVKIAMMKAIDGGRFEHPCRTPRDLTKYPPPTPLQSTCFHYESDHYCGPLPSTSSKSQNRNNAHHTTPTISSQAPFRFPHASHPNSVSSPPTLNPTEFESDDSMLSEGSINDLF